MKEESKSTFESNPTRTLSDNVVLYDYAELLERSKVEFVYGKGSSELMDGQFIDDMFDMKLDLDHESDSVE